MASTEVAVSNDICTRAKTKVYLSLLFFFQGWGGGYLIADLSLMMSVIRVCYFIFADITRVSQLAFERHLRFTPKKNKTYIDIQSLLKTYIHIQNIL